ncbi:hypothetical protein IEQ34_009929 [Dendrobium chrysotoxum]|uniref:Uncharacterized protein n=1 Tax=Dendrobium chrysotoxum TaxID=161865 RepID=A0AAV7H2S3_DENCH|nr:hypothetical protein IEQ34_009929 [Dendrobium chrysotoxum]
MNDNGGHNTSVIASLQAHSTTQRAITDHAVNNQLSTSEEVASTCKQVSSKYTSILQAGMVNLQQMQTPANDCRKPVKLQWPTYGQRRATCSRSQVTLTVNNNERMNKQPDIRRKYVDMSLEDSSCGAKRVKLSNSVESKNEHLKKKISHFIISSEILRLPKICCTI